MGFISESKLYDMLDELQTILEKRYSSVCYHVSTKGMVYVDCENRRYIHECSFPINLFDRYSIDTIARIIINNNDQEE